MTEFSEDQVKRIIRKAAELQKESTTEKTGRGLTMEELLEIGEESGLNIDFIKTAALEFENQNVTRHSGLTDTHIFEERTFETQLTEDIIWEETTNELAHHFGGDAFGKTTISKGEKKWSHLSISGIQTIVSLKKHDSIAKMKFSQRVGLGNPLTEGIMYGGSLTFLIMVIIGVSTSLSASSMVALSTGLWSISSLLVYQLDVLWRKKKLNNLKSFASKIVNQLPDKVSSVKTRNTDSNNTSSIEIEPDNLYQTEENLKNNLRSKE